MNIGRLSIASAMGAALLLAISGEAFAGPEGYCDAFARDIANRKARTTAGNALTGTSLGAILGLTDAAASTGDDATAGAGSAAANNKWRRAYIAAYDDCMYQYEDEKVAAVAKPSDEQVTNEQPADEQAMDVQTTDDQAPDDQATNDQATNDQATDEQPVEQIEEPVEEPAKKPAKAKAKGKPQPGTQAWNNSCDKRYRSFNPKTGMYMSLSGKMA